MRRAATGDVEQQRTERGLDRLVNFTDATVAIAITVLVLPLVDLATDIEHESLHDLFDENRAAVFGFTVTFFVIARLWVAHHRIFETVADYDAGLIWWSFLWLFSIVTLPFAANVLSNLEDESDVAVFGLYIGTIFAATATMLGSEWHLKRHPELRRPEAPDLDLTVGLVMAAFALAALVIAVTVPAIGLWALLLLVLTSPVHRVVRTVRDRPPTAPER